MKLRPPVPALVAFVLPLAVQACSGEGPSDPCARPGSCPDDTVRGTIQGIVSVEAAPLGGVTVMLQGPTSGSATTDSNGGYFFPNRDGGTYTLTLSGFPSDVLFSQASQAATISSNGQTVTVNFSGAYVRDSDIQGSVTASGRGVGGVTVTAEGTEDRSTATGEDGGYEIAGLRAGSYTVSISGYDANRYEFVEVSRAVQLGATSTQVVDFQGEIVFVPWTFVSAGSSHTCARTTDQRVFCWGRNDDGRLGDGTNLNSSVPVLVAGDRNYTRVASGVWQSCAVDISGAAFCWGSGGRGQLGNGANEHSNVPVAVAGGLTFSRTETGAQHVCALTPGQEIHCWGRGDRGQLGNGTMDNSNVPVLVAGGPFLRFSRGRQHTCAIGMDEKPYCWGDNQWGQLGDGTTNNVDVPWPVATDLTFTFVMGGGAHTCGRTTEGDVYCWGTNDEGQLGNGSFDSSFVPMLVEGFKSTFIVAGWIHTCSLDPDGKAWCWGHNGWGQLGDGTTETRLVPTPVVGDLVFVSLDAGHGGHTCGITVDEELYCWGDNSLGQLGDGTLIDSLVPVRVRNPE
jgi:alpha-tubulin suppressor-like RCC1 family protein